MATHRQATDEWVEREPETATTATEPADLIVVSNREPYQHRQTEDGVVVDRPVGGLTVGLDRVMQRTDGTWIAWGDADADRAIVDTNDCVRVPPDDPGYTLRRVWLDEQTVREYYYGFSNQVLWPLCHDLVDKTNFDAAFWRRYREVNERFAAVVSEHARPDSVVWFQDYHLALAPRLARESLPASTPLMQFWHIPWPAWDTFRVSPQRIDLLDGLLGNDLLGFHVPRYAKNFLDCVANGLDDASVDRTTGEVTYRGCTTRVEAFPMGVDSERIGRLSRACPETFWPTFARRYGIDPETTVAVGVDRLDYTKGIPERLDALYRFWETHPEWRGRLTYVQKASESRSRIDAYRELQREVGGRVDRINSRFGTDDWTPVVVADGMLDDEELYGLYRRSDLALVTPVRDGMNLVAKEYVAAQTGDPGVLLLSDLAGAGETLGTYATTVEPYDTETFAATIGEALAMDDDERRERIGGLRDEVETNDLAGWMDDLFAAIGDVASTKGESPTLETRETKSSASDATTASDSGAANAATNFDSAAASAANPESTAADAAGGPNRSEPN